MSMLVADQPWKDIGLKRRPRWGRIAKFFQPGWWVALEHRLGREMLAVFSAWSRGDIETLVTSYMSTDGLARALGFASRLEGAEYMTRAILSYANTPREDWPAVLLDRVRLSDVPDKMLCARITVGTVVFCRNLAAPSSRRH
jgi:hypothetical protein